MKELNYGLMNNPILADSGMAYNYHYDQLNRLTSMNAESYVYNTGDSSVTYTALPDYGEHVVYDPNGNILNYFRNGTTANGGPLGMDSLTYKYQHGNNKLDHVNDAVAASNYSVDIDNEDTLNYRYDQIGNLTKDSAAGIDSIYWTVYGKIWRIVKFNGDTIKFRYGPDGNRIAKEVFKDSLHRWTNTYYVHDATGNIMATYQWINKDTFNLDELMMYGSSRLGTVGVNEYLTDTVTLDSAWYAENQPLTNPNTDTIIYYTDGLKQYELTNHLGNVLATITDRHIPKYFGSFLGYIPEVASAQDYYPFGMLMPGRIFRDTAFRFGFNNKEKDDEVEGGGNSIDYGARIYDPRLGRFFSPDPLAAKFPFYTPYQFAGDNPILNLDLDGLEDVNYKHFQKYLNEGVAKLSKIGFGLRGSYDEKYWHPSGPTKSSLTANEGVSPSKALKAIFKNPEKYSVDCAQFCQLADEYAFMKSMGSKQFDKFIQAENQPFTLRQYGSTGMPTESEFYDRQGPNEQFGNTKYGVGVNMFESFDVNEKLKSVPVGTKISITNNDIDPANSPNKAYHNENIVKVGDNKYAAHGFDSGKTFTLNEVIDLVASYGDHAGTEPSSTYKKENVYVSQIVVFSKPIKKK